MSSERSVVGQSGVLLLLLALLFAGSLGAWWPYLAVAGVGLLALRGLAALVGLLGR
jgi:hypothetical protein